MSMKPVNLDLQFSKEDKSRVFKDTIAGQFVVLALCSASQAPQHRQARILTLCMQLASKQQWHQSDVMEVLADPLHFFSIEHKQIFL